MISQQEIDILFFTIHYRILLISYLHPHNCTPSFFQKYEYGDDLDDGLLLDWCYDDPHGEHNGVDDDGYDDGHGDVHYLMVRWYPS